MKRDRINPVVDDEDDWGEDSGRFAFVARLKQWQVRDLVALTLCVIAAGTVTANALFMQTGPHPAPIFALAPPVEQPKAEPVVAAVPRAAPVETTGAVMLPRPRPLEVAALRTESQPLRSRGDVIAAIQKELAQRGFYDGPMDGFYGPKTDGAIRDFEQAARLRPSTDPGETLLAAIVRSNVSANRPLPPATIPVAARPDPLAELIAPPPRRIMAVQRALSEWGYGQLRPTGVLDPETEAAIEKLERDRKLPVTGQVSERVIRELAAITGRPIE